MITCNALSKISINDSTTVIVDDAKASVQYGRYVCDTFIIEIIGNNSEHKLVFDNEQGKQLVKQLKKLLKQTEVDY